MHSIRLSIHDTQEMFQFAASMLATQNKDFEDWSLTAKKETAAVLLGYKKSVGKNLFSESDSRPKLPKDKFDRLCNTFEGCDKIDPAVKDEFENWKSKIKILYGGVKPPSKELDEIEAKEVGDLDYIVNLKARFAMSIEVLKKYYSQFQDVFHYEAGYFRFFSQLIANRRDLPYEDFTCSDYPMFDFEKIMQTNLDEGNEAMNSLIRERWEIYESNGDALVKRTFQLIRPYRGWPESISVSGFKTFAQYGRDENEGETFYYCVKEDAEDLCDECIYDVSQCNLAIANNKGERTSTGIRLCFSFEYKSDEKRVYPGHCVVFDTTKNQISFKHAVLYKKREEEGPDVYDYHYFNKVTLDSDYVPEEVRTIFIEKSTSKLVPPLNILVSILDIF